VISPQQLRSGQHAVYISKRKVTTHLPIREFTLRHRIRTWFTARWLQRLTRTVIVSKI